MVAHCGDSRCYVIDVKGNVKYCTVNHADNSSYITDCFFTGRDGELLLFINFIQKKEKERNKQEVK